MSTVRRVSQEFYNAWRAMSIFHRIIAEPNRAFSTNLRAMLVLYNQTQCTQKKLGRTVGLKASGCSALVNLLVEQGLVERVTNPKDRREVLLMLTPQGREHCRREMGRRYEGLDQKFSQLSPQDQQRLLEAFRTIQEIQAKVPLEMDE